MSIPTTQTLGIVRKPTPAEAAVIRDNLRRLARDEADTEVLCAAIVGAR